MSQTELLVATSPPDLVQAHPADAAAAAESSAAAAATAPEVTGPRPRKKSLLMQIREAEASKAGKGEEVA